ncbi:hypothetical protein KIN20_028913 [Parelaphostrongylus tenuis]|uniref:Uncharacterized protein n=1 Tax=Parelaphostrongylus tenuis TaxID=148309 RepID=A0AAD5R1H6_PARTN|nr:hypothetical protein KIN20_028913 [Parelaphostrongylus tenuis]
MKITTTKRMLTGAKVLRTAEFKMGCKAAETPGSINNSLDSRTASIRGVQWWFKKLARETHSTIHKSQLFCTNLIRSHGKQLFKLILLRLHEMLQENSTSAGLLF